MRKKQILVLLMVFTFINIGVISFAMFTTAKNNSIVFPTEEPLMDLTHENFAEKEARALEVESIASPIIQPAEVGDGYTFMVSDDGLGIDYPEDFVVVFEGDHILLLITKDAYDSFDGTYYHFDNPIGDDSEPWLRSEDLITNEMLEYLMNEFDDNMYDTMAEIYGVPASRPSDDTFPDYEERDKIWTLIFNIRDEAYYNPAATSYIAGYFSLGDSNFYQRNIMHIDTFEWERRCGDADNPWFDETHPRARPNLYEGAFAHEYEHMIHADIDPDEPSWVDEGLADIAGFFCGYGHPDGHLFNYIAYHPYVSLTFWGGALEDYGCAYLFQLYLFEHFGGSAFTSALVQEQANGIEGIENTLRAFGFSETFDEVYDAWTIANYLDDTRKAGGKYGYETLDIGSAHTRGATIEWVMANVWWGPPVPSPFGVGSDWFYGIEPQPYTAHYIRFNNRKAATLYIDGDDFSGTTAYSGTYEWYSDAQAWAWRSFYQSFDIPATGATLNFMTFFEIEGDWDYGYVEVYDQDTGEWYTLDAPGTVDYVAHAQDNPNCPDGREPTDYEAALRWYAFTGYSGGWIPVSMDLTPFAGHTIDVYFTLWQDGAFTLQNMYVDDISIPEIGFVDDVEAGEDGWTSTGWYVTDGIQENSISVTLIDTKWVSPDRYPESVNNAMTLHGIWHMTVDPATQMGMMKIHATPAKSGRVAVAIISNRAGHILSSHYDFMVLW
ncbi:MAG: hypothetical protein ACFE91_00105 [Promethearchaeota archaeon]